MYQHSIEAEILFENGEKEKAVQMLETFVSTNPSDFDELVQTHEQLLRFKQEMNIDTTQHIVFYLNVMLKNCLVIRFYP